MQVKISHIRGSRAGEELSFDKDRIVLGRSPSCDVTFDPDEDILVSGKHAEISFEGGSCILRDLGSTNGTLFKGKKISETLLEPGDEVELGKGGPRFLVEWSDASGGSDMEGKTVMMSLQSPPTPAAAIPPTARISPVIPPTGRVSAAPTPAARKSGGSKLLRILLVVLIVFVGAVAAMIVLRKGGAPTSGTEGSAQTGSGVEDLQRQLREKDQQIEQLMKQLQEKNDEIERLKSGGGETPVSSTSVRAPLFPERVRPSAFLIDALLQETEAEPEAEPETETHQVKYLKQLYKVVSVRSRVRGMPGGIPRGIAEAIGDALESTDRFVKSKSKSVPYAEVEVTDFESEKQTTDTKKKTQTLGKLGGLAGIDVPDTPADAKTQVWNAQLAAIIRVYDETGTELFDQEYSSALRDRKTTLSGEGLKTGELFKNETPEGDVLRKVTADGVEAVMAQMKDRPWISSVRSHSKDTVTIDGGRDCQIERGDIFEVVSDGVVVGRIRITFVDEDRADGEVLSGGDEKFRGMNVQYVGKDSAETRYAAAPPMRQVVVEKATSAYDGPGFSFNATKGLSAGSKLDLLYWVGSWAKVSDTSGTFWVSWDFVDDVR